MLKRQKRKRIKASKAAEILGYNATVTVIRKGLRGEFQIFRDPNAGPTAPYFCWESEIYAYRDRAAV